MTLALLFLHVMGRELGGDHVCITKELDAVESALFCNSMRRRSTLMLNAGRRRRRRERPCGARAENHGASDQRRRRSPSRRRRVGLFGVGGGGWSQDPV